MRRRGTGTIERRGTRFFARLPVNGERRPLGCYDTREEAEAVLDAARGDLTAEVTSGVTLSAWSDRVFARRERDGIRDVVTERNRWKVHVVPAEMAGFALATIRRGDVQCWLDGMLSKRAADRRGARKLSRTTVQNTLNLLRAVLEDAAARCVIPANPARDVRLPRRTGKTREPWTYLTPAEQTTLIGAVDPNERPAVRFAIGTGLRQGEQRSLLLEDVHLDGSPHVVVRFGSPGKPTKSGKIRTVPLFGQGLIAVREQLLRLRGRANPHKLLFPTATGCVRQKGAPTAWSKWIEPLGRAVRWHDLRHTCASSLVAGWWGRAWRLEEVRAMLGHSSITVTERYAHLAGTALDEAARATVRATVEPTEPNPPRRGKRDRSGEKAGSHLRDLNSRPTVYETARISSDIMQIGASKANALALKALDMAATGDARAWALLVEVAEWTAEATSAAGKRLAAGEAS